MNVESVYIYVGCLFGVSVYVLPDWCSGYVLCGWVPWESNHSRCAAGYCAGL